MESIVPSFCSSSIALLNLSVRSELPLAIQMAYSSVPNEKSSAVRRRTTYMEFYKENLSNGKELIQNINDIEIAIHEYLDLRFEEEENLFFHTMFSVL